MNDASSGVRGETVHVPRSDAGRLAFELLANVLRERCLPGTGGAGNQDVVTFDVLLDRPKTRREMIDLAVSMLEFLRHEFVAERTGVTYHLGGGFAGWWFETQPSGVKVELTFSGYDMSILIRRI